MSRKVIYLTGTRADYGLMRQTLLRIEADDELELELIVTGSHLDPQFGMTVSEIEADGFTIAGRIEIDLASGEAFMARAIGTIISGCCMILEHNRPDLLLVLGDRGEMLAGAIAAVHLNIHVVHIHGGERSGTIDESVRHAISKLSHLHFVSSRDADARLIRMGEDPRSIFQVGAPGLTGLKNEANLTKPVLCEKYGVASDAKIALVVFHPVVQEMQKGPAQLGTIISGLRAAGFHIIALRPNSDLGGDAIRKVFDREGDAADMDIFTHLPRNEFVSWMAIADVMVGNSSAGIIEAATFGTPVINIGKRQNLRDRNANVIDAGGTAPQLADALKRVSNKDFSGLENRYGDGQAAQNIVVALKSVTLDTRLLEKVCAY